MTIVAILIPAYQPDTSLLELVKRTQHELNKQGVAASFCVVNDGSDIACDAVFQELNALPGMLVLHHAVNLGKGAALKTGINALLTARPGLTSIVTADCDGQHSAEDIAQLAQAAQRDPSRLYLGVRQFDRHVPLRSRFGNVLTRNVTRVLTGIALTDTQTGLRAVPRELCIAALRVPVNGYDFEMECLITFRRLKGRKLSLQEIPIRTIYHDDNAGSHFNPLLDSMRIYFVFLRYCAGSLLTFLTDYLVFLLVVSRSGSIGLGITLARAVATFVSFYFNRHAVFQTKSRATPTFLRFLLLVVAMGSLSYLGTSFLADNFALRPAVAKLLVESVLFFASFALNDIFVFGAPSGEDTRTNWDDYYARPYRVASFTRSITTRLLIRLFHQYAEPNADARMLELGGANSCFMDALRAEFSPAEYHIVDNNRMGLNRAHARIGPHDPIHTHEIDLLTGVVPLHADITFSVGLIEHFDIAGTAKLIDSHFQATRDGGMVVISFPTATWLYRTIRQLAEWSGMWIFFDERPLPESEVLAAAQGRGRLIYNRINWAIGLTQRVMVFRKGAIEEPGR